MGYGRVPDECLKPLKKKHKEEQPSLYEGERKENPDWDKITDFGEGDNPLGQDQWQAQLMRFAGILILVTAAIVWFLGLPDW